MSFCEVITCNSKNEPGRTYHRFPNDTLRRQEWLKILGIKAIKYKTQSAVCSRHFRTKDYCAGGKRLIPTAVPALKIKVMKRESKSGHNYVDKKSPESSKKVAGLKKVHLKKQMKPLKLTPSNRQLKDEVPMLKKVNFPLPNYKFKDIDKKVAQKVNNSLNAGIAKSAHGQIKNVRRLNRASLEAKATSDDGPNAKKRKFMEDTLLSCKKARVEVAKLTPDKLRNASCSSGLAPSSQNDSSLKTMKNLVKSNESNLMGDNISNIEQTIGEMQNKIKKLEQKSVLDEKKIETFKKALIEQREKDIKILMDEKENELLLRMDLLYLDYDPQRICRLCLQLVDKMESLISLFWPLRNQGLIPLIKNTTGIQVELEDGMPSRICNDCLQQIRKVDWIRRRTQRSNILIKKFLAMKKDSTEGSSSGLLNEKIQFGDDLFEEEMSGVLKIEDVFSLENSSEDELLFGSMGLKEEPVEEVVISTSDLEERDYFRKSSLNITKKCKKCRTTFTNLWSFRSHINYCERKFRCTECNKAFWNSRLLFRHKRARYSCVSAGSHRSCYECQTVFRWKWQLLFHVLLHDYQPCRLCDAMFYSVDQLKRHFTTEHMSGYWS